jgi:hypothetical protein
MTALRQNMGQSYDQFSGRTLEQYFQTKAMESGQCTIVGNWWDRKGGNEIDMIALNEFNHTGVVAEIKRNPRKINLVELGEKSRFCRLNTDDTNSRFKACPKRICRS